MLSIPLPSVPPTIIATLARGGKESAEDLLRLHNRVIGMLRDKGLHCVSQAGDGTEVERKLQRMIVTSAESRRSYHLRTAHGYIVEVTVPLSNGLPSVMVQDAKHAAKTGRNQLFSGARLLVLGSFALFYDLLRSTLDSETCPLYRRDVEGMDRQDDRACRRLLSAEFLKHLSESSDNRFRGLQVYLFVIGETLDAWQHRALLPVQRVRIVLRTLFFFRAWHAHTKLHPEHTVDRNLVSREFLDIVEIECQSLIGLILVYRDFYERHPLLPWLHSTEVCEHLFGMLRQLKNDFDYGDLLFLMPKLRTLLLGDQDDTFVQASESATASGSLHTYFDVNGLDLNALQYWPSDEAMNDAATAAWREAETLLVHVGIDLKQVFEGTSKDEEMEAPARSVESARLIGEHAPPHSAQEESRAALRVFETAPLQGPRADDEVVVSAFAMAAASAEETLTL